MALVEFHQILLSSLAGRDTPKLLPLPVLPGPSLALTSLRRHFPHAAALHYWLDPSTLVTLPKVRKGEQSRFSGGVTFPPEGDFFILPFLDPSVNFFVTEEEVCPENGLSARVAVLEDLVAEQRDFFTSIHTLLSQAIGRPQSFDVTAETAVDHLEHWSSLNNQEVCADCGGEPESNLNPDSEAFFPSGNAISKRCDQPFKLSSLNPNCKTFEPITASYSLGNELQTVSLSDEVSVNESNEVNISGRLYKVPPLNPDCKPFDPAALSLEQSIGDTSKSPTDIKEKEEDENNNKKVCAGNHPDTSTNGKGDKDKENSVPVNKVVVEDEVCKSVRPKIILKVHGHRRS